jgi:prolyl oligopeptidase
MHTIRPRGSVAVLALTAIALSSLIGPVRAETMKYPHSKTVDVIDDYHGTLVADPFRWLEDPDADETEAWVEAQNEVTFGYLHSLPGRDRLTARLTQLWNYERYSTPWRVGSRLFWFKNDGLQNQSVLYVQEDGGQPRVLLDPNALSDDGTVSLGGTGISEDGRYMAWSTSVSGSDWRTWYVRDVQTGQDLGDEVKWSKFSGASWAHDNSGFYYSAYDAPREGDEYEQANYHQRLWFHRIGTSQSEDVLVYERPDHKEWGFGGSVTEDGRYLIITVWMGSSRKNAVFYKDLDADGPVVELLDAFDADYSFVANDGSLFYFRTNLDAPRGRLIAIDVDSPARRDWKEVIPESEDVLQSVRLVANLFVANYMHDAHDQVKLFDLTGDFLREVELPSLGSAGGFSGRRSHTETYYSFTSFLYPTVIYRYDFATGTSEVFREPEFDFDFDAYTTRQVFYESKDGTRVPMFLVHRKDLQLDGNNPALLYGYGGFNVSQTPSFSAARLVWLEMGGVYAMANLRGGGEYGEKWHQAGTVHQKQNVFDDFIAAAEWLVAKGYTRPEKLACQGGSNGGLLVGAVINQRPDLWGAALPAVGVMDMLRFHKFTIGWAWVSDYGSSDDPEQFATLQAYSPYHNLRPGRYPATLVTTADHDDRVVPGHSFKYAARLQQVQQGEAPVLIRIETKAGHGAGKPTSMQIEEVVDRYAFLMDNLEIALPASF